MNNWLNILEVILKIFKEVVNIFIIFKGLFYKKDNDKNDNADTIVVNNDVQGIGNKTTDENSEEK